LLTCYRSNSNTVGAIYWLISEVFRSEERLTRIKAECLISAVSDVPLQRSPCLHLPTLLSQTYLQACFAETLRLRTHIFITRFPDTRGMDINEWSVPAKNVVMTCSTVPHMDATLWNTGTASASSLEEFWPERFIVTENVLSSGLARSKHDPSLVDNQPELPTPRLISSNCAAIPQQHFTTKRLEGIWIPFGGGAQMCPGRKLAKAETFFVTALLVTLFDIELCNPETQTPLNWSHFGTGVIKPAGKTSFRIRRRRSGLASAQ
jgi:cytochrome P450